MDLTPTAARLMTTNYPPSKIDEASIQQSISFINRDLQELEDEIDQQRASIQSLTTRRDELTIQKQAYQGILSPIRRLTPDILSEILRRAVAASLPHNPRFNLSLLRVCQAWRTTMLQNPDMWTTLAIPKFIHAARLRSVAAGIAECIRRSRALPLFVSFDTLPLSRMDSADLLSFIQAKQRWKKVTLTESYLEFFIAISKSSKNPFKALETVCIKTAEGNARLPRWVSLELTTLPKLTNLGVEIMQHLTVNQIRVPLAQLVRLSVAAWSNTGDYLDMLRHFPNLEECSFAIHKAASRGTGVAIDAANPPSTVFCPKLRRFKLGNAEYLISLLLFVKAPNLQELILTSSGQDPDEALAVDMGIDQEFGFFVNESRCQLRQLELDNVRMGRSAFVALLESLRFLRELKVRTSQFHMRNFFDGATVARLKELIKSGRGATAAPRLELLNVCVPRGAVTRAAFAEYVGLHGQIKRGTLEYLDEDQGQGQGQDDEDQEQEQEEQDDEDEQEEQELDEDEEEELEEELDDEDEEELEEELDDENEEELEEELDDEDEEGLYDEDGEGVSDSQSE